jgi:hypothetical protein
MSDLTHGLIRGSTVLIYCAIILAYGLIHIAINSSLDLTQSVVNGITHFVISSALVLTRNSIDGAAGLTQIMS